jgi:hypothetical protein
MFVSTVHIEMSKFAESLTGTDDDGGYDEADGF